MLCVYKVRQHTRESPKPLCFKIKNIQIWEVVNEMWNKLDKR